MGMGMATRQAGAGERATLIELIEQDSTRALGLSSGLFTTPGSISRRRDEILALCTPCVKRPTRA